MEGIAAAGAWLSSLFSSGTVVAGAAEAGAAATAGTGISAGTAAAFGAGTAVAGAVASRLMAPKIPGVKAPTPMPDQNAIEAGRRRSVLQQVARRGRASTILTDNIGDTLG